jgi:hypothetical protein
MASVCVKTPIYFTCLSGGPFNFSSFVQVHLKVKGSTGASHSDGIALVKVAINNSFFFFAHKYIELKVKCFINKKYH